MAKSSENFVEYAYVFYFLNFLAESTFRDIDTVGDPKNTCFWL